MKIHSVNELHLALAKAISNNDIDILYDCEDTVSGWIIGDEERRCMHTLIQAVFEILEE